MLLFSRLCRKRERGDAALSSLAGACCFRRWSLLAGALGYCFSLGENREVAMRRGGDEIAGTAAMVKAREWNFF